MQRLRWMAGPLLVGAAAGCGEPALLEELAPEQSCRRTIVVGPPGVPVADAASGARATGGSDGEGDENAESGTMENGTPPGATADTIRDRAAGASEVEWLTPRDDYERGQLNAWCAGVGPAVVGSWAEASAATLDSLAVVSWNLHIGGGDLDRLVDDLRAGRLTGGEPVEDFVILLQEAYREGAEVPVSSSDLPFGSGGALTPPSGERRDVVEHAEALGLSVFYAPSMRSGAGAPGEPGVDRGNAILSTLPLEGHRAIELPVARQRRVAIAATARGVTTAGRAWSLQVASVHLENDARGWMNDAAARLRQSTALLEGLGEDQPTVAAGDFNTWTLGQEEATTLAMLDEFEATPPFPPGPTYIRGYGLLRRYLDYMFFRLPEGATARYRKVEDPYNSDHFPLVGWVVFPED